MKTATLLAKTAPLPLLTVEEERRVFFERCYLALLSSALNQFEVRDRDGQLRQQYEHPKLEAREKAETERFDNGNMLGGEERQKELGASIRRSESIRQKVIDADEEVRMQVVVDRCYRMASIATDRHFQEREVASDFVSKC
jgi:hypothetical protein